MKSDCQFKKKRQEVESIKKLNHSFQVGDYVLFRDRLKRLGISPKFKPVFDRIPLSFKIFVHSMRW